MDRSGHAAEFLGRHPAFKQVQQVAHAFVGDGLAVLQRDQVVGVAAQHPQVAVVARAVELELELFGFEPLAVVDGRQQGAAGGVQVGQALGGALAAQLQVENLSYIGGGSFSGTGNGLTNRCFIVINLSSINDTVTYV